jgi:hypothetical protein
MLHLLQYWTSAKSADSYFVSAQAAYCLFDLKFWLIGVVKTTETMFFKSYLGKVALPMHGSVMALTALHDKLLVFEYCDYDCHYFISACSNAAGGNPICRMPLQQLQPIATDKPPEQAEITMNCPQAVASYYTPCSTINWHNCCRQSGLDLKKFR